MDPEYARLQQELHANIDIRNKLLTFSFTTVLTVIGIGLANLDSIFFLAYLLPFFIIIPCTSRIIYYKDLYAQQAAYLTVYYEKFMTFEIQNNTLLFCKDHCNRQISRRIKSISDSANAAEPEMFILLVFCIPGVRRQARVVRPKPHSSGS